MVKYLFVILLLGQCLVAEEMVYPIAVIGAGAGGTMAVQRAVLNNMPVLLFKGAIQEQRHSRGTWVRRVHNIPGLAKYERALVDLRNEVLSDLARGPFRHNLAMVEDSVYTVVKEPQRFKLTDSGGRIYYAKYLVMATGMMDEQPHIQGSIRHILNYSNAQTVAYCPLCDGHRSFQKKTAVIGYSESAAQSALYLSERYNHLSTVLLTNGHSPEFSSALAQKLQEKQIQVLQSPIQQILGNQRQLTGFQLEDGRQVGAEIGFVALGIRPNNQLALQLGAKVDERGLVITNATGESSVPDLFVIGDLRSNSLKQIYTAWQQAVESVQVINQRLYRG